MKIMVSELSLLMTASNFWRNTSKDNVYYSTVTKGKLFFSESSENSYASIKTCKDLSLIEDEDVDKPVFYVEWPSGKHALIVPESWRNIAPLEGRPYSPRAWDCYTLAQDYYKANYNFSPPPMTAELKELKNGWSATSFNGNEELDSNWEMTVNPQKGDAIFFGVGKYSFENKNPNHCGIYLGDGKFLHHYSGRISCIEDLEDWSHWILNYVRSKHV